MAQTPSDVSPTQISSKSLKIYRDQKKEVFQAIFALLDSDQDNIITAEAINISDLPYDTVQILRPIFDELEQIEEGIDQSEFIEAICRLYHVSFSLSLILRADLRLSLSKQTYANF